MDRSSDLEVRARFRAAALVGLALGALACSPSAGNEEIASAEVPTISAETGVVSRQDLVESLLVRGAITTVPNEDVKLAAQVSGRVVGMSVAEGDSVARGQVVAEIEPGPLEDQERQAKAGLEQAQAALTNAQLNLTRTERLLERGIAAGKEVEDARAQLAAATAGAEQARAALDTARRQRARARVVSPIAGQVVRRFLGVGEQVDGTPAQPLLEVANVSQVEVAARVPAERLARVRVGQAVAVSTDAYPGQSFAGEVKAVAAAIDPATNAALVRIGVRNPDRSLKVGMFAEARIGLQRKDRVLTVPPSAVSRDDEGAAVYRVTGQDVMRTAVKVGLETPEAVEVVSGLQEGQKVLVSGIHGLGERAKLAAKP